MLYVVIALLIFGVLIATHELGHFAAAKLLGVKVNEFSVGMGPAIINKEKGETLYSLRALPIGGYCAMEGEDEESSDPRSFERAAEWKKFIILVAGAAMNFLTGILLIALLYTQAAGFYQPVFSGYIEGYGLEDCGLLPGDIFLEVDGHRIYTYGNLSTYLSRSGDAVDFVVERDGKQIELDDVYMPLQERTDENGNKTWLRGFNIGRNIVPATLGTRIQYTWYTAVDYVRAVWMGLGDIVTGAVGLRDLSGPVGIVDAMSQIGNEAETPALAAQSLTNLAALIAVNLAVMNLLPLPALDGGRILFLAINGVTKLLFGRKIDPKYESYIHMTGLVFLMGLMVIVALSDVGKLFGR